MKSVKRTTENSVDPAATIPVVRFTDYDPSPPRPSSELLGYYHSSAMRTDRTTFCAKLQRKTKVCSKLHQCRMTRRS
jgi:hypothetical protein